MYYKQCPSIIVQIMQKDVKYLFYIMIVIIKIKALFFILLS